MPFSLQKKNQMKQKNKNKKLHKEKLNNKKIERPNENLIDTAYNSIAAKAKVLSTAHAALINETSGASAVAEVGTAAHAALIEHLAAERHHVAADTRVLSAALVATIPLERTARRAGAIGARKVGRDVDHNAAKAGRREDELFARHRCRGAQRHQKVLGGAGLHALVDGARLNRALVVDVGEASDDALGVLRDDERNFLVERSERRHNQIDQVVRVVRQLHSRAKADVHALELAPELDFGRSREIARVVRNSKDRNNVLLLCCVGLFIQRTVRNNGKQKRIEN